MTFQPSPQQAGIFSWVKTGSGSAIVEAVAGSGKTTTLIHAVSLMSGHIGLVAYNRKIADEIKARLAAIGSRAFANTFHGFGFYAIRKAFPGVRTETRSGEKFERICGVVGIPEFYQSFVKQLVSLAKQRAIGVLCSIDDEAAWWDIVNHFDLEQHLAAEDTEMSSGEDLLAKGIDFANGALRASIAMDKEIIDYDDMIYGVLIHNIRMWQNDWLLVDEAQDTNPARRCMARKMLKPGGRAIFVGDPRQAIYGFTGADNDSLDIIAKDFSCRRLPLTVTYRCPKAVVAHAQQWVSHIEAHESAPEGIVRWIYNEDLLDQGLLAHDAILCRNTKPLVATAYSLIRKGIACHVEGKEIGRGLIALATKWKVKALDKLAEKLSAHLARETQKYMAKGQEQKAAGLEDRVETLLVLIDGCRAEGKHTLADLKDKIVSMFDDTKEGQPAQNLTLSTVHKSKGREWSRVFLLGRDAYMPSKYARQAWQMDQEINLIYVAVTRAKAELVEVLATVAKPTKPE